MLQTHGRTTYGAEHVQFRDSVRRFLAAEFAPNIDRWEAEGRVDRGLWRAAGSAGLLCPQVPEAYGGPGLDFSYNAVVNEELSYAGSADILTLQSDVSVVYLIHHGSEAQKRHLLPGMVTGEVITAIAMTEPGAGSDLQGIQTTARRDGDDYVIDGSKTYITNGQNGDLIIVVAKTDPTQGAKGISLFLVDADTPGFARGRNLDKIGQHDADTSELFFQDARVPASAMLGQEGRGFYYLMGQLPQERLSIAVSAQAGAQRAFDLAVEFTRERKAFGKTVLDFQNTKFVLADLSAKLQAGWAHIDWCLNRHYRKELTATEASAAKLLHTELQWECCDKSLQLHGGAGYMNEYPIARLWRDARVTRIFGGTSEIMKEVVGRAV